MNYSKKLKRNDSKYEYQRCFSDCGVVCLMSLFKIFGKKCCYSDIYKKSNCSFRGTNINGLKTAAKSYDLDVEAFLFENINDLIMYGCFPCILLVKKYYFFNHYIICCERPTLNSTLIFDPSIGFRLWGGLEFNKFWKFKIALIVIEKNYEKSTN
jgi:ABC-type bacteriocin/lantibiotic exporter with double-glycine peptidase domain